MPILPFPRQFRHATSPPTPTLPSPRRFGRDGPQIHGTCPPQHPLLRRHPRSPFPPPSPPTLSFPCRFNWGWPQIEGKSPPRLPPLRRRPRSMSPPPSPPTLLFARRFTWRGPQINRTSPPHCPPIPQPFSRLFSHGRPQMEGTCTLHRPPLRRHPADFAVSLPIELGLAANERDVSPRSTLCVVDGRAHCPRRRRRRLGRFLANSPRVGLKSTGRVPRSTLRLVDVRACRPRPRPHRRRLCRFLPDSATNRREKSPMSPLASSLPTFATVAAAAADLDVSAPIGPQIKGTDTYCRCRLCSACRIGRTASSVPRAHAPCSKFMAVGDVWHIMHAACLVGTLQA
ncbi:hypothetical protein MSAN_02288200 [Mycena sanguinolenta]|uniref:Uncharacterized protein n=1 Tax=Mycena sanguinolenta TaxID=230812 RepID=A0A8H6X9P9_9AGAR|nr:hypothetical protein MSAN_02288200 [Mycena sanguinolenta]